jgi:hypothetical protein
MCRREAAENRSRCDGAEPLNLILRRHLEGHDDGRLAGIVRVDEMGIFASKAATFHKGIMLVGILVPTAEHF